MEYIKKPILIVSCYIKNNKTEKPSISFLGIIDQLVCKPKLLINNTKKIIFKLLQGGY